MLAFAPLSFCKKPGYSLRQNDGFFSSIVPIKGERPENVKCGKAWDSVEKRGIPLFTTDGLKKVRYSGRK
jgi:hypothetical protein